MEKERREKIESRGKPIKWEILDKPDIKCAVCNKDQAKYMTTYKIYAIETTIPVCNECDRLSDEEIQRILYM